MRIDFVITELFVGGAERCLTELAIGLTASGEQVRVMSIGTLPSALTFSPFLSRCIATWICFLIRCDSSFCIILFISANSLLSSALLPCVEYGSTVAEILRAVGNQ